MAKTEYGYKAGFKPCKGCKSISKCRAAGQCMGAKNAK